MKAIPPLLLLAALAAPISAHAQDKVVFACEISNTSGLKKNNGQWETMTFRPGEFYMGSRKHFFLAMQNNAITVESAKEIFHSSGADCH